MTELYNLEADPGERDNLAGRQLERTEELKVFIETWLKDNGARRKELGLDGLKFSRPAGHRKKELRALGYM